MWRLAIVTVLALVLLAAFAPYRAGAEGESADVIAIIIDRAGAYGVSADALIRLARCESDLDPSAIGDHGSSFGLYQISGLPTGLLAHYHAMEGGSAFSAWLSADYVARTLAGEFAGDGITLSRWSCW